MLCLANAAVYRNKDDIFRDNGQTNLCEIQDSGSVSGSQPIINIIVHIASSFSIGFSTVQKLHRESTTRELKGRGRHFFTQNEPN